jgi:hypothetical protein
MLRAISRKILPAKVKNGIKQHAGPVFLATVSPLSIARGHRSLPKLLNPAKETVTAGGSAPDRNPLIEYFDAHTSGNGIHKWRHYFEIYHRHFQKFVGREINVLEIGIYGGGSLGMWQNYFGSRCRIFGVDIEPECKIYESDRISVSIGDQADRGFWRTFLKTTPSMDIIIDDGGHLPDQQIATFEELFPSMKSGGVYLCEDIHGDPNRFAQYIAGLSLNLHGVKNYTNRDNDPERSISSDVSPFQSVASSIHTYPFVVVIEKRDRPINELVAARHGTHWTL